MDPSSSLSFLPFRLDLGNQSLWRGDQETVLKPKTFAILAFLVRHAGRLVTRQEILETVWPGIAVNEEVVTARIRELRQLLGEERKTPQYIQTVHGRLRAHGGQSAMVALVKEMVRRAAPHPQDLPSAAVPPHTLTSVAVPERLRSFIDQQVDRLSAEDQRLLEAASLIGQRFSTATVAAAI